MQIAVCPGSFDPVTSGHLDIIGRAATSFERLIVGVFERPKKKTLFSLEDRLGLIERSVAGLDNVQVTSFDCLLVDFARMHDAKYIVKGLRAISDFEYEFQMAQLNHHLSEGIETLFMMASPEYSFLSSSGVKEIASFGGRISGLVPPEVEERLIAEYGKA